MRKILLILYIIAGFEFNLTDDENFAYIGYVNLN